MKCNKVKKMLAASLAATMMLACTLTASASGGSAGSPGVPSRPAESTGGSSEDSSESSSEDSSGASDSFTETIVSYGAGAQISVGGTSVQSTVGGAFAAKTVQGMAVTTPLANVMAGLGLTGSQTPHIIAFDTDAKKSPLAMQCVNAAAEALGGQVVASLNIDLGARDNGKRVTLSNGSVGMVVGLPKNADTSKTFSVVCVQPGGKISILKDQDASPATVTFEVKAGLGTYGIVGR